MRLPLQFPAKRKTRLRYAVLLAAAGLVLSGRIALSNLGAWGIDFNQFYAASHLAGTGRLYDWQALQSEEHKNGLPVRTARLPVVAYGVKAISWLPYRQAQWIWFAAGIGCLAGLALIWPNADRVVLLTAMAWSTPAVFLLLLGQDTPFWLFFFAAGFALLASGNEILAGIVLAFCLCKYHLAFAVPLVLAAKGKWRACLSAALAVCALLAAGFAIEGRDWISQYWAVLREPAFSPGVERMPNLRGLSHWLPQATVVQSALSLALAGLLIVAVRRSKDWGFIAALCAACGLLLAPHGYGNDCLLLLPLLAYRISSGKPSPLFVWALFMATPLPVLLLASGNPVLGQIVIVGFVFASLLSATRAEPLDVTRFRSVQQNADRDAATNAPHE